jgi:tight adherence protein C
MRSQKSVPKISALLLFIFPSLFLVTLGPALIMMSESFQKYFNQ